MKELAVKIETQAREEDFIVQLTWEQDYRRIATSSDELFIENPRDPKGGQIDIIYVPHGTSVIALYEDRKAKGPDKLRAFTLYPEPGRGEEDPYLQYSRTLPSLRECVANDWIPIAYLNGNIRVKASSGKVYATAKAAPTEGIQTELHRVDDRASLLKFACGMITEEQLKNLVLAGTSIRESKPAEEHSESVTQSRDESIFEKDVAVRDRLLHEVNECAKRRFAFLPFGEHHQMLKRALTEVARHCAFSEDTRGENVVRADPPEWNPEAENAEKKSNNGP